MEAEKRGLASGVAASDDVGVDTTDGAAAAAAAALALMSPMPADELPPPADMDGRPWALAWTPLPALPLGAAWWELPLTLTRLPSDDLAAAATLALPSGATVLGTLKLVQAATWSRHECSCTVIAQPDQINQRCHFDYVQQLRKIQKNPLHPLTPIPPRRILETCFNI